ncbi:hypothetical protein HYDPIDRAFT_26737 [Hydnomerulius pinastri MD-312]|nr:hypothetical protein HYDPIDRAFT_26737 [Hydnomerulius pinastri MD-312]
MFSRNFSPNHIKSLEVLCRSRYGQLPPLTRDIIHPLFACCTLRTLNLGYFPAYAVDQALISEIASSFPLLEVLCLGNKSDDISDPTLGYDGLITLLKSCPKLRHLGITFDTSTITKATIMQHKNDKALNDRIRVVDVGCSRTGDPALVAFFLKKLMPRLESVGGNELEQWSVVSGMLAMIELAMELGRETTMEL